MSDALVARIAAVLQQIPHSIDCDRLRRSCAPFKNHEWDCRCDREQRIAQRVTAAIEAAEEQMAEWVPMQFPRLNRLYREADDAALAALGVSSGEESTQWDGPFCFPERRGHEAMTDSGAGQGLTVERLAALLREADRECAWLGVEAYSMPDEWATSMASWLLPRLGSAAPAPAPSEKAIDAAQR